MTELEQVGPGVVERVAGVGHPPCVCAAFQLCGLPAVAEHRRVTFPKHPEIAGRADAPKRRWIKRRDFPLHYEPVVLAPLPSFVDVVFCDHHSLDVFVREDAVARVGEFFVHASERLGVVGVGQCCARLLFERIAPGRLCPRDAAFHIATKSQPARGTALVLGVGGFDLRVHFLVAIGVAFPVCKAEHVEPLAQQFCALRTLRGSGLCPKVVAANPLFAQFFHACRHFRRREIEPRFVLCGNRPAFAVENRDARTMRTVPPSERLVFLRECFVRRHPNDLRRDLRSPQNRRPHAARRMCGPLRFADEPHLSVGTKGAVECEEKCALLLLIRLRVPSVFGLVGDAVGQLRERIGDR